MPGGRGGEGNGIRDERRGTGEAVGGGDIVRGEGWG